MAAWPKKIKSTKNHLVIKLKKVPKIIDQIKNFQKDVFLVGFKAETNVSKKTLVNSSLMKIKESGADLIIANDIGSQYQKNPELNEVVIVGKSGEISRSGRKTKRVISKFIRDQIEQVVRTSHT